MFTGSFACRSCDYRTKTFIAGFVPTMKMIDLVFQHEVSKMLRIVTCAISEDDAKRISSDSAESNEAWEVLLLRLQKANMGEQERWIDAWQDSESLLLECPHCGNESVKLLLEGII